MLGKTPWLTQLLNSNWSGLIIEDPHIFRGGSRTAATSKMERFVMIVNGWKLLTIITKRSTLDVLAVLDPPLILIILTGMSSWSWALFWSKDWRIIEISSINSAFKQLVNRLVVSNEKVHGRVLSLDISWHWLLKKWLKILAFSTKFRTSLSLTNKGEIIGVFSPLTKVLIVDQSILDEVLGLLSLSPRRL